MNNSRIEIPHAKARLSLVLGASMAALLASASGTMADGITAVGGDAATPVTLDAQGKMIANNPITGFVFDGGTSGVDINSTLGVRVTGAAPGDTTTSVTAGGGVVVGNAPATQTTIKDSVFTTGSGVASTFGGAAVFNGGTTFNSTDANGNTVTVNATTGAFQQVGKGTGAGRSITLDATNDIANFTGMTVSVGNGTAAGTTTVHDGLVTIGGTAAQLAARTASTGNAGDVTTLTTANAGAFVNGGAIINNGLQVNNGLHVGAASDINMGDNIVHGVAAPVAATDAANKAYVDTLRNWTSANFSKVNSGIAAAAALQNPDRTGSQTWALAINEGFWDGHTATGFSGITRVANLGSYDFSVGGSFAVTDRGDVAGRVSAQIAGGGAPAPLK
jgi:hypothetical protein